MLGFLNKLFRAFRAGNGDLAFALGHPDGLVAPGTFEIFVLPVLQPLGKAQIFAVFLIPLVGVARQHPEDGPPHTYIGKQQAERPTIRIAVLSLSVP